MFKKYCARWIVVFFIIGLFLFCPAKILGTSIDRISVCNLEGYPGDLLKEKITLTTTDSASRIGFWENYYKRIDGDDAKMDISSWISVEPREFTLKPDERTVFILKVQIPENAAPGLWGATSSDAGLSGHAAERRMYILFRDAQEEGNLYSGMLIPISVQVLGKASPFLPIFMFFNENSLVVFLLAIIALLLLVLLVMLKNQKKVRN
jgi:hypothetical protein